MMQPSSYQGGINMSCGGNLPVPGQFQFQHGYAGSGGSVGDNVNLATNPVPFDVHSNFTGSQDHAAYAHGNAAGTTRLVCYDGNGRTTTFTCIAASEGKFQPCTAVPTGVITDTTSTPSLIPSSTNPGGVLTFLSQPPPQLQQPLTGFNHKFFHQQQHPNQLPLQYRNENFVQRKYANRVQGRSRFLRVNQNGGKSGGHYRNFSLHQNRHYFVSKNMHKLQRFPLCHEDHLQQASIQFQQGLPDFPLASGKESHWMSSTENKDEDGSTKSIRNNDNPIKPSTGFPSATTSSQETTTTAENQTIYTLNSNTAQVKSVNKQRKKISEPKGKNAPRRFAPPQQPMNLTYYYEDISEEEEGSDQDNQKAMPSPPERLLKQLELIQKVKTEGVVVKKEPGELDSESEDKEQEDNEEPTINKKRSPSKTKDSPLSPFKRTSLSNAKKRKSSSTATTSTSFYVSSKNRKIYNKRLRKDPKDRKDVWRIPRDIFPTSSPPPTSTLSQSAGGFKTYSYHDDRCISPDRRDSNNGSSESSRRGSPRDFTKSVPKTGCQEKHNFSSVGNEVNHYPSNGNCCAEAEVDSLKERLGNMKQTLRSTKDKLLEATVVGSKKTKRLEDEVEQLKEKLNDTQKNNSELKESLKKIEVEFATKAAELANEKQERNQFEVDMARMFQDQLLIENQKMKAFFDIEVRKMQAVLLSQNMGHYYNNNSYFRNPALNQQNSHFAAASAAFSNFLYKSTTFQNNDATNQANNTSSGPPSPTTEDIGSSYANPDLSFAPDLFMFRNPSPLRAPTSVPSTDSSNNSTGESSSPVPTSSSATTTDSPASPEPEISKGNNKEGGKKAVMNRVKQLNFSSVPAERVYYDN